MTYDQAANPKLCVGSNLKDGNICFESNPKLLLLQSLCQDLRNLVRKN